MSFITFILFMSVGYLIAQTNTRGTCNIWGDPHLVEFPVSPEQAALRLGFRCQWAGRMLIVKNEFIEFYVNVTDSPFWNEYYEINLFSNTTKLCTITPDTENCSTTLVEIIRPRGSSTGRQIFYDSADGMEISIYSQWIGDRLVYNIEVTQSFSLILKSVGLCITHPPQCILESSPQRKRSTSEATASEVCDLFIVEANKTAKQLTGDTSSRLVSAAREACITDVLLTNDVAWGSNAAWLVLTDSIRQARFSHAQQKALMMQISTSIEEAVGRAKPEAESIMGPSTTVVPSDTIEPMIETSTTTSLSSTTEFKMKTSSPTSSSDINKFKHNIILLSLMLLFVCSSFY